MAETQHLAAAGMGSDKGTAFLRFFALSLALQGIFLVVVVHVIPIAEKSSARSLTEA